jgi:hypothetical protein
VNVTRCDFCGRLLPKHGACSVSVIHASIHDTKHNQWDACGECCRLLTETIKGEQTPLEVTK